MKKFVIILLVACLALGGIVAYTASRSGAEDAGEPVALYDPEIAGGAETAADEAQSVFRALDYEKIWALHEPDEVVGSVDGRDLTWDEYFYWLHDVGAQAESYIQMMILYGQSLDWTDKLSADSEETLAEYVLSLAGESARQLGVVEEVAEENGVTLTPENEAELAEDLREVIESACGAGATEEDLNAYLEENFISRSMYDRIGRANYLFQNTFSELYGLGGEKVSEADALAYLADNGYLGAAHILFMTIDPETYEPLDEETIAQKLQQAEAVSAELRAIEDVEARAARFAELKEQYCEDSGKTAYPDGYLFTPGTMVEEFENGTKALEEYEVSEPILSAWGYHVIMRLPLSAEMTMQYSESGTPMTARSTWANEQFNAMMNTRIEQSVLELGDAIKSLDLTQFLKETE